MNIEEHTVGTTPVVIFNSPAQSSAKGEVGSSLLLVRNASATATVHLGGSTVTNTDFVAELGPGEERFFEVEVGADDLYAISTEAATSVETARGLATQEPPESVSGITSALTGPSTATSTAVTVSTVAVEVMPANTARKDGRIIVTVAPVLLGFDGTTQNIPLAAGDTFDLKSYTGAVWAIRSDVTDATVLAVSMT